MQYKVLNQSLELQQVRERIVRERKADAVKSRADKNEKAINRIAKSLKMKADVNDITYLFYKFGLSYVMENAKIIIQFKKLLDTDLWQAVALFQKYGKGFIYTLHKQEVGTDIDNAHRARKGGVLHPIVMEFTRENRYRMEALYGTVVAITSDGIVYTIKAGTIAKYQNRKKADAARVVNAARREKERIKSEAEKEAKKSIMYLVNQEDIVKTCTQSTCRKRAGRANSLSDLGKYVDHPDTKQVVRDNMAANRGIMYGHMSSAQRDCVRRGALSEVGYIENKLQFIKYPF
jgi:hypothetical protein